MVGVKKKVVLLQLITLLVLGPAGASPLPAAQSGNSAYGDPFASLDSMFGNKDASNLDVSNLGTSLDSILEKPFDTSKLGSGGGDYGKQVDIAGIAAGSPDVGNAYQVSVPGSSYTTPAAPEPASYVASYPSVDSDVTTVTTTTTQPPYPNANPYLPTIKPPTQPPYLPATTPQPSATSVPPYLPATTPQPPAPGVPPYLSATTPQPPAPGVPPYLSATIPQPPAPSVPPYLPATTPQPPAPSVPPYLPATVPQPPAPSVSPYLPATTPQPPAPSVPPYLPATIPQPPALDVPPYLPATTPQPLHSDMNTSPSEQKPYTIKNARPIQSPYSSGASPESAETDEMRSSAVYPHTQSKCYIQPGTYNTEASNSDSHKPFEYVSYSQVSSELRTDTKHVKECTTDCYGWDKSRFADCNYCNRFVTCRNSVLKYHICPYGYFYNYISGHCEYDSNHICVPTPAMTSQLEPGKSALNGKLVWADSSVSDVCTVTCKNHKGEKLPSGQYPHCVYCDVFILCTSGVLAIQVCPDRTYYNKNISVCDHDGMGSKCIAPGKYRTQPQYSSVVKPHPIQPTGETSIQNSHLPEPLTSVPQNAYPQQPSQPQTPYLSNQQSAPVPQNSYPSNIESTPGSQNPYPSNQEPAPQNPYPPNQEPAPQNPYPPNQEPTPQNPYPSKQEPALHNPYPSNQEPAPQNHYPSNQEPAPQNHYPSNQEPAPQNHYPSNQEPALHNPYPPNQVPTPAPYIPYQPSQESTPAPQNPYPSNLETTLPQAPYPSSLVSTTAQQTPYPSDHQPAPTPQTPYQPPSSPQSSYPSRQPPQTLYQPPSSPQSSYRSRQLPRSPYLEQAQTPQSKPVQISVSRRSSRIYNQQVTPVVNTVYPLCVNSCRNVYEPEADGQFGICGYCNVYLRCFRGKNQTLFCNDGYQYDVTLGQCVEDTKGECNPPQESTTSTGVTPQESTTSTSVTPQPPASTPQPTSTSAYELQSYDKCLNSCKDAYGSVAEGRYGLCGYCNVYMVCAASGQADIKFCDDGEIYDLPGGKCVKDDSKTCIPGPEKFPVYNKCLNSCDKNTEGRYSLCGYCNVYLDCDKNGVEHRYFCDSGMEYSAELGACVEDITEQCSPHPPENVTYGHRASNPGCITDCYDIYGPHPNGYYEHCKFCNIIVTCYKGLTIFEFCDDGYSYSRAQGKCIQDSNKCEPPKLPSDLESLPAKPKYSYNTTETGVSVTKVSETVHQTCIETCFDYNSVVADGLYAHCSYCDQYFHCRGRVQDREACPAGSLYNYKYGSCDPDSSHVCTSRGPKTYTKTREPSRQKIFDEVYEFIKSDAGQSSGQSDFYGLLKEIFKKFGASSPQEAYYSSQPGISHLPPNSYDPYASTNPPEYQYPNPTDHPYPSEHPQEQQYTSQGDSPYPSEYPQDLQYPNINPGNYPYPNDHTGAAEQVPPYENQNYPYSDQQHTPLHPYLPPPEGYQPPPQSYLSPPEGYQPPPQPYLPPPEGYQPPPQPYLPPPEGYQPPPQDYLPPPPEYNYQAGQYLPQPPEYQQYLQPPPAGSLYPYLFYPQPGQGYQAPPGYPQPSEYNVAPLGYPQPSEYNVAPPGYPQPSEYNVAPPGYPQPSEYNVAPPEYPQPSEYNATPPGYPQPSEYNAAPLGYPQPSELNAALSGYPQPSEHNAALSGYPQPSEHNAALSGYPQPSELNAAPSGYPQPSELNAAPSGYPQPSELNAAPSGYPQPSEYNAVTSAYPQSSEHNAAPTGYPPPGYPQPSEYNAAPLGYAQPQEPYGAPTYP